MAGILGIKSTQNVSRKLFYGLNSLQHRGQEGCGIAVNTGEDIVRVRHSGLVIDSMKEDVLDSTTGNIGIGNVR